MCTYLLAVLVLLLLFCCFLSLSFPSSLSVSLAFFMLSAGNLCAAAEPRLSPIRTASWFRLTSSHMPHTLTDTCAHMPLAVCVSVCVYVCVCLCFSLSIIRHAMRASFVRTFNVIINSRLPFVRVYVCACVSVCVV